MISSDEEEKEDKSLSQESKTQTAEFGGTGTGMMNTFGYASGDMSQGSEAGYNSLVLGTGSTFTTMRVIKQKEAQTVMRDLINKAQFQTNMTMAANEAIQRFKALVEKKYKVQNEIRNLKNNGVMRASQDADLIRMEEFLKLLSSLCEQAKQQIKMEIVRFKESKQRNTQKLILEFQMAQAE